MLTLTAVREARDPEAARRIIVEAIPEGLAKLLGQTEFEAIRLRVNGLTDIPARARFEREDFVAAAGVFLIVFLSTFPVVIPFLVMSEVAPALRVSHTIAVSMLFVAGWSLGRHAGQPGWQIGAAMVIRRPPPRPRHYHASAADSAAVVKRISLITCCEVPTGGRDLSLLRDGRPVSGATGKLPTLAV